MSSQTAPTGLKVYLLGSFEIEGEHGSINLPARKVQSLLAYLILHPEPAGHSREKLAALFWGDSPDDRARDSLRTALKTLRQQLGDDLLLTDRETVQLNPAFPLWVDANVFAQEMQLADFRFQMDEMTTSEIEKLQTKVDLYRGELLQDFYDDWLLTERERYCEQYLEALFHLTQVYRAASEYTHALEYAQKILAVDPANERAYQHLMFCHLALGDRAAALKQYDACVRALQSELAVEPSRETTALYQWIKQAPSERAALAAQLTNLPIPLSSFIGRKQEVTELKQLIATTRLLTLTGAGGSGKTRLAIQVATDLIDRFYDGVWWVDLAPLLNSALTPQAIARALGVRESPSQPLIESLKKFLRKKQLLLILDNCEHLITACARLADDLLAHCLNLKILATSREALAITGETVYQVPTLRLPQQQHLTLADLLLEYEGIRFFVERACAVQVDFVLTERNAAAVLQICQRLDGIPLALELAAARAKVLTVEHIAERLHDRFNLLTQGSRTALPRQQTLRATIDWSYDLLPEEARLLFRRLSVFAGGFTLEAAEAICSTAPLTSQTLLDQLSRLVDRSLVKVERQGAEARYRMLETIGEYAHEKLDESGETQQLRRRQRDFFIAFAEQAEPKLKSAEQFKWLDRLEVEHDNLRAAWEYALESDTVLALQLASALLDYWFMRGNPGEGREWLARLLPQTEQWGSAARRAHVLGVAGRLAYLQRDFAAARRLLEEDLAIARSVGGPHVGGQREMAFALLWLGWTAHRQRDDQTARAYTEECLALYQALQDPWGIAMTTYQLAGVAAAQGRYAEAEERYLRSLAQFQELGDKFRVGFVLNGLGELARLLGDYEHAGKFYQEHLDILKEQRSPVALVAPSVNLAWVSLRGGQLRRARELFEESLRLSNQYGNKTAMADCLAGFAGILVMRNKAEEAAQLFGAVEALLESIGMGGRMDPSDQKEFDHYVAEARTRSNEAAFASAWAEGRALAAEQAMQYALEKTRASV
jgi:non-specific serine/threonine protein kinase